MTLFHVLIHSSFIHSNQVFKYADDTTLLVPENSDVDLAVEFKHIKDWASRNRLKINTDKTKEIVLRQLNVVTTYNGRTGGRRASV